MSYLHPSYQKHWSEMSSTELYQRDKGCTGKCQFETPGDAQRFIDTVTRRNRGTARKTPTAYYRCRFCDCYHITSRTLVAMK